MQDIFKFIIDARKAFIQLIDERSLDELNTIPPGFNNNIIWNFGHIVASTPALCYVRTGVVTDTSFIAHLAAYAKGTKPTTPVLQEEVESLKEQSISTIHQLQKDYDAGLFDHIHPFSTTTFGTTIHTIDELLATTAGHDNLHFGYAMAQQRFLKSISTS